MSRAFDIIVFGATGFTGELVARRMAVSPSTKGVRWAIAGRSKAKLTDLHQRLGLPSAVDILVADASDAAALDAVVSKTRVVIACAGPYARHGLPVVGSCVRHGVHYVDVSAEFQFMRRAHEQYDAAAREKGVVIVPACGFDSVPSDVMNHFAHKLAAEKGVGRLAAVRGAFSASGGVSRGTLESAALIVGDLEKKDLSPLSLVPPHQRRDVARQERVIGISFSHDLGRWVAPFFMAPTNERVTRKSNVLLGRGGTSYCEMVQTTFGVAVVSFLFQFAFIFLYFRPTLAFLRRFVFPKEGDGPSKEHRDGGRFRVDVVGRTKLDGPATVKAAMTFGEDAYNFTAVSAVEMGMALLRNETMKGVTGGVLTPASAAGDALCNRLQAVGCTIKSLM